MFNFCSANRKGHHPSWQIRPLFVCGSDGTNGRTRVGKFCTISDCADHQFSPLLSKATAAPSQVMGYFASVHPLQRKGCPFNFMNYYPFLFPVRLLGPLREHIVKNRKASNFNNAVRTWDQLAPSRNLQRQESLVDVPGCFHRSEMKEIDNPKTTTCILGFITHGDRASTLMMVPSSSSKAMEEFTAGISRSS